jgi:4-hydroxybutyrate CoA-transferase
MDWKEKYGEKVLTADEAVKLVKSGEMVRFPMASVPVTLATALAGRKDELKDVKIFHAGPAPLQGIGWWSEKGWEESFQMVTEWPNPVSRPGLDQKLVDLLITDFTLAPKLREEGFREDIWSPDFFMAPVSPPNEEGQCSLGTIRWYNKEYAKAARCFIAEIDPDIPWVPGDSAISVSEMDYLVEKTVPTVRPPMRTSAVEIDDVSRTIGEQIVSVIRDGDTIQMGVGVINLAVASFLKEKNDLGIHSEIITEVMVDLVKKGVVTGKRKSVNQGKAVAAAIPILEPSYLEYVADNPIFELRSIEYTNNIGVISSHHNMTSINNCLSIDLTGQMASETLGRRIYSAIGGQVCFMIGSLLSPGGKTIMALPSTAKKGTVSRIVPTLETGTVVSIPRNWVDFVVTEYGMVNLLGKTQRQRAEALISIAHPDFREELKKEARRLYWA